MTSTPHRASIPTGRASPGSPGITPAAVPRLRAVDERPRRRQRRARRGRRGRSGLPAGLEPGRPPALGLGPRRLVEPLPRGGAADRARGRAGDAALGLRAADVRLPRRRPDRLHRHRPGRAFVRRARPESGDWRHLDLPFTTSVPWLAAHGNRFAVFVGSTHGRTADRAGGRRQRRVRDARPVVGARTARGLGLGRAPDRVRERRRPPRARLLLPAGQRRLRRAARRAAAASRGHPRRPDLPGEARRRPRDPVPHEPRLGLRRRELRRLDRLRERVPDAPERAVGRRRRRGLHRGLHATSARSARSTRNGSPSKAAAPAASRPCSRSRRATCSRPAGRTSASRSSRASPP